jgi:hypothetical protein
MLGAREPYTLDAICIRSRDRDLSTQTTTAFTLTLPRPIQGKYLMVFALIPGSAYPVTSNNNTVPFNENATNKTATIPVGSYTGSTLAAAAATALTTSSGGFATYSASFSSVTAKITITSTGTFSLQFGTFPTNSAWSPLGWNQADTGAATSQVGPNIPDLASPISLNIRIDPGSCVQEFCTAKATWSGLVVPLNVQFASYSLISSDIWPQAIEFVQATKRLSISVLGVGGGAIDLNGNHWDLWLRKLGSGSPEVVRY